LFLISINKQKVFISCKLKEKAKKTKIKVFTVLIYFSTLLESQGKARQG